MNITCSGIIIVFSLQFIFIFNLLALVSYFNCNGKKCIEGAKTCGHANFIFPFCNNFLLNLKSSVYIFCLFLMFVLYFILFCSVVAWCVEQFMYYMECAAHKINSFQLTVNDSKKNKFLIRFIIWNFENKWNSLMNVK